MPCSDGGRYEEELRAEALRTSQTVQFLEERLCKLVNAMVDSGVKSLVKVVESDAGLMDWFQDHEAKESADLKAEALKKLTAREKRLLGLK